MKVVSEELVKDKKVLLRYDIDVPIENGHVMEDLRLQAGLRTLQVCLENAKEVIMMGHIGRPYGKEDPKYSVKPVYEWFEHYFQGHVPENFKLLENLRFEEGEEASSLEYAKELAALGDFFVNEAFASHNPSASTTLLPTLLPHAAGFCFAEEVEVLTEARNNPKKPLIVIIGGAKVADKYKSVVAFSKFADKVLVGGLLPKKIKEEKLEVSENVVLADLASSGIDISTSSLENFIQLIKTARQVIWAGPVGKYEDQEGLVATRKIAETLFNSASHSDLKVIAGGGDTTASLGKLGLLDEFLDHDNIFVSTGGGAMLKLLTDGTLPTIKALD